MTANNGNNLIHQNDMDNISLISQYLDQGKKALLQEKYEEAFSDFDSAIHHNINHRKHYVNNNKFPSIIIIPIFQFK